MGRGELIGIFSRILRRCAVRYNSTDGICRLLCG
uniref:Uncharacterized protein n=1 Tax=Siphoviridae sp. ctmIh35 TaxID=2827932 RepID=A0A8S5T8I7_9CAUD|nr:MAG TPA: hypothetical protein [Siphoviridae sp. ctmIh35]